MRATEPMTYVPGSPRFEISPALDERGPDRTQDYFLVGGGAGFKSAADFCNSLTAEAFSS